MSADINDNEDEPSTRLSMALQDNGTHAQPLLEVHGLNVGYDETQVLWDASLHVMRGEVVAMVGANGAGKSTLLSTLSGLLPAWSGTMAFVGQDITRYRAERIVKLGLAPVPHGRRLFPALTIEENLRLGAYTRRAGSKSAIAADLERVFALL